MNKALRIVIADDEPDIREYLQEGLPRWAIPWSG